MTRPSMAGAWQRLDKVVEVCWLCFDSKCQSSSSGSSSVRRWGRSLRFLNFSLLLYYFFLFLLNLHLDKHFSSCLRTLTTPMMRMRRCVVGRGGFLLAVGIPSYCIYFDSSCGRRFALGYYPACICCVIHVTRIPCELCEFCRALFFFVGSCRSWLL